MWNNFVMHVKFEVHMHNRIAMYVKFFTRMSTLLGMSEWAGEIFSGLIKCNHYKPHFYENAINFEWIPHENCKIEFHVHLYNIIIVFIAC